MKTHIFFKFLIGLWIFSFNLLVGAPLVTSISPFVGPSSGGTAVTITGSGFTGATAVNFGNDFAVFVVNSDSSITATSPAHFPQVVGVTVTAPSGTSPITSDTYFVYQGSFLAYVTNIEDPDNPGSVSVIRTSNNAVIATSKVGSLPQALAVTPDGTRTYVTNGNDNTVSVIRTGDNAVIATVNVGDQPIAVAITPDGTKAYVVNNEGNTVSVIRTADNAVIATIGVGSVPVAVAITPDGTKAYVVDQGNNRVSVIDTVTNTVIATIKVGAQPTAIAITPDGTRAYVVNANFAGTGTGRGTVSVIDTATNKVITTITAGIQATPIAITPDGTKAYVANRADNTVSVIRLADNTVIATVPTGPDPIAIAPTPDSTKVYVVNALLGTVTVIRTADDAVIATINVGDSPSDIAITPDGKRAYVVNEDSGTVSVINTATNTVVKTVQVEAAPLDIDITPDQAPLAKFSVTPAEVNLPTFFDASASVSPIGTIVSYQWDFGDGTSLITTDPTTTHIYTAPGTYPVTLTVTNSAGTSTQKVFNNSSSLIGNYNISSFLFLNGGPTATTTQTVTISSPPPPPVVILPPRNLHGHQVENKFATQTDVVNILTWKPPVGGLPPVSYRIYRDQALTKLAGVVSADERLRFKDHNRKEGKIYTYFVVSIDQFGNVSIPAEVVIGERH